MLTYSLTIFTLTTYHTFHTNLLILIGPMRTLDSSIIMIKYHLLLNSSLESTIFANIACDSTGGASCTRVQMTTLADCYIT